MRRSIVAAVVGICALGSRARASSRRTSWSSPTRTCPKSRDVAAYYCKKRGVPADN